MANHFIPSAAKRRRLEGPQRALIDSATVCTRIPSNNNEPASRSVVKSFWANDDLSSGVTSQFNLNPSTSTDLKVGSQLGQSEPDSIQFWSNQQQPDHHSLVSFPTVKEPTYSAQVYSSYDANSLQWSGSIRSNTPNVEVSLQAQTIVTSKENPSTSLASNLSCSNGSNAPAQAPSRDEENKIICFGMVGTYNL